MKKYAILLLLAAVCSAAPVIFTDPVEISGSGTAWEEYQGLPGIGGWEITFSGFNAESGVGVFINNSGLHGPGVDGHSISTLGGFFIGGIGGSISGPDGTFASQVYAYHIDPYNGSLALYDPFDSELVRVPISGQFHKRLIEHISAPGYELNRYEITITPGAPVPEPAAYQLLALGSAAVFLLRRSRVRQLFASRAQSPVVSVRLPATLR